MSTGIRYKLFINCIEKGEFLQDIEILLDLDIKDPALANFDKIENSFIRFMILIFFKMVRIGEIEEDQEWTSKLKFSKSLKIINNLIVHLPLIDKILEYEVQQSVGDLQEILSNYYAGDEFPFNAIWELFQKLTKFLSKYLIEKGFMNLIAKIMAIMENLLKSMNKGKNLVLSITDNEQYLNLIEALRHPIGLLIKKNSVDIKVNHFRLNLGV